MNDFVGGSWVVYREFQTSNAQRFDDIVMILCPVLLDAIWRPRHCAAWRIIVARGGRPVATTRVHT